MSAGAFPPTKGIDKNPYEAVYLGEFAVGWYAAHRSPAMVSLRNKGIGKELHIGMRVEKPDVNIHLPSLEVHVTKMPEGEETFIGIWADRNEDEADIRLVHKPGEGVTIDDHRE